MENYANLTKMNKNRKNRTEQMDDSSLGILNMDNYRVFGESSRNLGNSSVSERLNIERLKAFETLQKSKKSDVFKRPQDLSNKENSKIFNSTQKHDNTDYVPYHRPNTINISDLVTDETINLETSSSMSVSGAKDTNISFEPAEITGRSTLYRKDGKQRPMQKPSLSSTRLSVSEILASSNAPKARNLCESLREPSINGNASGQMRRTASTISSACTSYNGSHSLPRTADMSLSKASNSEMSFGAQVAAGNFTFASGINADNSAFSAEDFAPGELMNSKLLLDEISWAQKYAAIPGAALSEQAKAKVKESSIVTPNPFDSVMLTNSMIANDPNFSMGNFFNMRSDDIWNIVKSKSPNKSRAPHALVDEQDSMVSSAKDISITPKALNKSGSRVQCGDTITKESRSINHQYSKDSSHATEDSYMLSLSAIDRALCNLEIDTDESDAGFVNKFLLQAKKSKTGRRSSCRDPMDADIEAVRSASLMETKQQDQHDVTLENKENLDPKRGQLSDTKSFSESALNCTDMKNINQSSISSPRSPLSPINPTISISDVPDEIAIIGNDADIDEWPSTPIKTPGRRVRRTKSPHDVGANNCPAASNNTSTHIAATSPARSLSSTRIDGVKNAAVAEYDFNASPNLSKTNIASPSVSAGNMRSNNSLTVCGSRSASPAGFDHSPLSSPRSCMSAHATSSPSTGYRSPNLDSTSGSDRRYLNPGVVRKTASSPVISEVGSKYGCAVGRSASGTAARSTSRCSNSSEFSHRDGKMIPLKVTTLELSWSSTKLRTDVRKSMQVKNISNKRLVVRVEVHGPGFQIVNTQSSTLTLQSQECRTIIINFCPTVTGNAIGALSFYSPNGTTTANAPFLDIPLYGYGGHANIVTMNVVTGPVGLPFLTMGELKQLSRPLERSFKIFNKGPLLGFAYVSVDKIGVAMPGLCDSFEIRPERFLIAPGTAVAVRVVFRPKRDEIKMIAKKIMHVMPLGNLRIICGDEANRQRSRRLVGRLPLIERAKLDSRTLDQVWGEFPDDIEMSELEAFKEKPEVAFDLLTAFRIHEITLTVNHESLDETVEDATLVFPDADETVLFRTVCAAASPIPQQLLTPVDEQLEAKATSPNNARVAGSKRKSGWSVRPHMVEFDFFAERRQERVSILIRNSYKSRQFFEVTCNYKDLLRFTPCEGYVEPDGAQIEVEVNSRHLKPPPNLLRSHEVMIMIYMENERIVVPVKIPKDNFA